MRIKFLQTTPSMNPDFPFQAGQIIEVPKLTSEMRGWVKDGWAELVLEERETASLGASTPAVEPRPKSRGTR